MTATRKLFIANFAGACIVAWAAWQGYVQTFLESGAADMAYVIAAVFLVGVASTFRQACRVDGGMHDAGYLHVQAAHLYDLQTALFLLGIIGTALGVIEAFGGLREALATAEGKEQAGTNLLSGASIAFGSTVVGLSSALWTTVNLRILATAIDRR